MRSHYSNEVTPELNDKVIKVAGWVHEKRDLGKIKFLIIRDREGKIQVTAKEDTTNPKILTVIDSLSKESVILVEGVVRANPKAPGGVEMDPRQIKILNKSLTPLPLDVTGKVDADLDTRLNNRFMDVRKESVSSIFKIRSTIQKAFRDYFYQHKFIELNTPTIIAAASEGGTNLFAISYFEREAFLAQSPQLYKQMMMGTGLDKVFIVTPVFRAETHNTTRHLNEIVQMDVEVSFIRDEEDVLKYLEGVTAYIFNEVLEERKKELELLGQKIEAPKTPFKRLTYDQVLTLLEKKGLKLNWGDDITTEAERILGAEFKDPFFIKEWPTKVRSFYSRPIDSKPEICGAFDLMYRGIELASGAQRIHDEKQLVEALTLRGLDPKNFEFYLKAFRYGMPPHGGWSIGAERMTEVITGVQNIRECVLFPRDRTRLEP
ncbi:MAG: aspartate--tRNA(Asn) ligase [Candidatus Altiarchaeota archaeon]